MAYTALENNLSVKSKRLAGCWSFMPVILATWKAEIWPITHSKRAQTNSSYRPHLSKNTQSKMDWRCVSIGKELALQVRGLEFKLQFHKKKKK
jgi:hypothetical protein